MAGGLGGTLVEYIIKMGVDIDQQGLKKIESALGSTKLKAAAVGTALVAAGTGIYKFIKSTTAMEENLVSLARKQNQTVETTRASENALKAMGKTMQEVSKDPSLKKIYEDIVKVNKGLALPDMKGALAMALT